MPARGALSSGLPLNLGKLQCAPSLGQCRVRKPQCRMIQLSRDPLRSCATSSAVVSTFPEATKLRNACLSKQRLISKSGANHSRLPPSTRNSFPWRELYALNKFKFYFHNKGVVKRLKYLSGTVSSSSNARH